MTWQPIEALRWSVSTVRAANDRPFSTGESILPQAIERAEEQIEAGEMLLDTMFAACNYAYQALTNRHGAVEDAKAIQWLGTAIELARMAKGGAT